MLSKSSTKPHAIDIMDGPAAFTIEQPPSSHHNGWLISDFQFQDKDRRRKENGHRDLSNECHFDFGQEEDTDIRKITGGFSGRCSVSRTIESP